MKKFIYQDPRRLRVKSRPIDEDDFKSRQVLEGGGWRIVETIDDGAEAPPVSVETVAVEEPSAPATPEASATAKPKKGKRGKGQAAPATPEA
jgi:hypothetical protein